VLFDHKLVIIPKSVSGINFNGSVAILLNLVVIAVFISDCLRLIVKPSLEVTICFPTVIKVFLCTGLVV
jgi:ABC-type uncharacterized transport system permease subunit